jgi:hypothetical protein
MEMLRGEVVDTINVNGPLHFVIRVWMLCGLDMQTTTKVLERVAQFLYSPVFNEDGTPIYVPSSSTLANRLTPGPVCASLHQQNPAN